MSEHYLTTPLPDEAVEQLRIGDTVYLGSSTRDVEISFLDSPS